MKVVIGTRGSDLALTQTNTVAEQIRGLKGVSEVVVQIIRTSGDNIQNVPLSEAGTTDDRKGFFTKELEDALLDGRVDLAVHSYKDLPTLVVPGLVIAAVPKRFPANDVLIFHRQNRSRSELPFISAGSSIATASVRRVALIEKLWPDVSAVPLRGNLPTRLQRLKQGRVPNLSEAGSADLPIAAILLAAAGVERLRRQGVFERGENKGLLDDLEIVPLPLNDFPPAPAQGALALQCREKDIELRKILSRLNDDVGTGPVFVERSLLAALEGGCHLPLGVACRSLAEEPPVFFAGKDSGSAVSGAGPVVAPGPAPNGDGFAAHVFLGVKAQDNRFGTSVHFSRFGRSSQFLASALVDEVRGLTPVVFTGRQDRADELSTQFPIISLPLISVEPRQPDSQQLDALRDWLAQADKSCVLAVFSIPGARELRRLMAAQKLILPAGVRLAATAERTAHEVRQLFGRERVDFLSDDGTGDGLARVLLAQSQSPTSPIRRVLSIAAERGRPEFGKRMAKAGIDVMRLELYRTVSRIPTPAELRQLPTPAFVVLGSPSSAAAFCEALHRGGLADKEFRLCALGPTTATALYARGELPYLVSTLPDYEQLLAQLMAPGKSS